MGRGQCLETGPIWETPRERNLVTATASVKSYLIVDALATFVLFSLRLNKLIRTNCKIGLSLDKTSDNLTVYNRWFPEPYRTHE